ncbi:MAG TPA: 50S ribosomal protein L29 [Gemmatimonadota bacterium]|jgi:large subunit ribosomal protein L29|nr:50S ribosomal protein L29 [Gemmatimonadota bacterium]
MKTEEIREYTDEVLADRILEMEEELFRLRLQNETGQLENPLLVRAMRKDLARCKTIRREREREGRE